MSNTTLDLSPELHKYLLSVSVTETDLLQALRKETLAQEMSIMQISPEQGQMMHLLLKLINAKNAIEIGVYTGYSSVIIASALADSGKLIACDISEDWTGIARKYWQQAGIEQKIDLRLAPAVDTLQQLLDDGNRQKFDFIFIDADKENYSRYFDYSVELLKPGGLIMVDNVLWSGRVIDAESNDADTVAIRAFNKKLLHDSRVEISMIPISDGVTLARKR